MATYDFRSDADVPFVKHTFWVLMFSIIGLLAGIGGQQVFRSWQQVPVLEFQDFRGFLSAYETDALLFSTTTCPYCQQARRELKAQGVPFRELLIDESDAAKQAFKALGESGVPVLITSDRVIRGFQPERYRELFAPDQRSKPST